MVYVTSDIHGNSKRFDSILTQIKLQPKDTLYILGDVIDRYPDGIAILQRIMKMPNVQMLLGNHEYMMLNYLAGSNHDEVDWKLSDWSEVRRLWFDNGGRPTYYAIKTLPEDELQEIKMFLKALPINIDIEVNGKKYKLVHASNKDDYADSGLFGYYENETEYAVWKRWRTHEPTPKDHIRVCGHTPTITYQKDNPLKIWYGDNIIAIDCGAGFPKEQPYEPIYYKGRLSCLRLDDMKEFYSEEEY